MSRRNNVNPDHYKTEGRLRPDDAASARFSRAVAAKTSSRERPDRMGKGLYFERPEPAPPEPARAKGKAGRAPKKASSRAGAAKKSGARKAAAPRRTAAPRKRASTLGKAGRTAKRAARKK